MEAVASGDEIAGHFVLGPLVRETNERLRGIKRVDADVLRLEVQRTRCFNTRVDQVSDDLVLAVDRDGLSGRELRHVDAVPSPVEADVDAFMAKPAALQPLIDTHSAEQIHGALFEHAGADAVNHVLSAAVFDDDGIDAHEMQDMPEQQPGWTGADDAYLSAAMHAIEASSSIVPMRLEHKVIPAHGTATCICRR